jgi:uncharacterized membrane protein
MIRRWRALDAARGLSVVAMVAFHLIWDLAHFGYIARSIPWSAPVTAFGHSIAFAFLFIAGVSLVLAHRDHIDWRAFWRRFGVIAGAAALVSLGTWLVFPAAFVFFGILHCIAAASLLAIPFLLAPWPAAVAAGVFFFAAPHFLAAPIFNSNWLQWLGLSTTEPLTQDWRPLFPWAGALLLGVGAARFRLPSSGDIAGKEGQGIAPATAPEPERPPSWLTPRPAHSVPPPASRAGGLAFLGRHSLPIYLAHQPLLFALFTGLAAIAPPPEDAMQFVAECERSCRAEGSEKQFCHDACVCTAEEAARSKALAGVTDDEERGRRLREIAARCVGMEK